MAMTPDREDENRPFLDRWSRRKLEQETAEPEPEVGAAQPPSDKDDSDDEQIRLELQKNCEDAEAIDFETLDAESDYSPFFKDGVPKALKSAALRTLWRSSPVFANLDGLNDYDENFNDPDRIKKFVGTAWRVGKGYLRAEPDPADIEVAAEDLAPAEPGEGPPDSRENDPAGDADKEISEEAVAKTGSEEDRPEEKADPEDVAVEPAGVPDIADDVADMPEKVPLRSRLALDDWGTG
jgi:hypothetical protein